MEPVILASIDLKDPEIPEGLPPEGRMFIEWLQRFVQEQRIENFTFSHAQLRMVQEEATSRGLEFTPDGLLVCPRTLH